jgi:sulfite exporter TauE/SafE
MQNTTSLKFQYHFFRLLGYLSLGSLAGFLGDSLLYSWLQHWGAPTAAILTSLFLTFLAWQLYFEPKHSLHVKIPGIQKIFSFLSTKSRNIQASGIGFFTAFLPCGWLYSFVLIALASGSWISGGLTLFVFWAGTLPILLLGQQIRNWIPRKALASIILVLAIVSLALKFSPPWLHLGSETCKNPTPH